MKNLIKTIRTFATFKTFRMSSDPNSQNSLNSHKSPNKKGFSLVELLVVVTIMAILSVVAYMALGGQTAKARNAVRIQDLSNLQSALEIFFISNDNSYPDDLDGLEDEGLITELPQDPIEDLAQNYVYGVAGNKKTYQIAATLEPEKDTEDPYAYVIGNGTNLIGRDGVPPPPSYPTDAGASADGSLCTAGTAVTDGGTCLPYDLLP